MGIINIRTPTPVSDVRELCAEITMTAKQHLCRTRRLSSVAWFCAGLLIGAHSAWAQTASAALNDAPRDAMPRPMDPGAVLPFDADAHRLIDLRDIVIGTWVPDDPAADLFTGGFGADGEFLRLDLALDGLVNPPGSADPFAFEPFKYGDHPVYGFIEIDMDGDVWTGGELAAPEYRYLGNVVRFGGNVLLPTFTDRVALDGSAFDGAFLTSPFVERHGEEFHLALIGGQFGFGDIEQIVGDDDGVFEEGETWNIRGPFFHRAHGYELFSFMEGGRYAGEYAPDSDLQFRHDPIDDVTYLSLVLPLTRANSDIV